MAAKKPKTSSATIAANKKARHEYFVEQEFEAGLVLEGWEVRSLREGRAQISDSYVFLKDGEAWLLGSLIQPLISASTHVSPNPMRYRKLLLHKHEIGKLFGAVTRQGYSVVPLSMFWKKSNVKLNIAIVHGKKDYDKREDIKERDWKRDKQRLMKANAR